MLSEDCQNLLARILLALAEGERNVEDARKELSYEDDYDIQTIFKVLDNNGDNFITAKDLQNYLYEHGLEVNFKEVKLLILFYDQDHDFALTYGEIFKIVHPGKEYPKLPAYIRNKDLNNRVDTKLYNLLEQEILLSRTVLALLDEIKHKKDFNIHNAFHALKYYACITGESINLFLKQCGMDPTSGDIRAIVRRLDINKDEIIDFCEFHAFLGYPDCSFCCPCFPCPNCGIKYCDECLQDIPCFLLGCDHSGMDSKLRCTSVEHNPHIGQFNSFLNNKRSPNSLYNSRFSSNQKEEDELPVKVDRKLFNFLEQEILLARTLISLLEEIKHKKDFNIHNAFHCLKYYACITGDSINLFLKKCGYQLSAGDINAIVKRLDINRDEIIDFCEFHAFLGFPDCKFCCPCFPCGNCGVKYCDNCLQDIPCYLLGCDHYKSDSKLKCTSFEHNPGNGADPYESLFGTYKKSIFKNPELISNFNNTFYSKNSNTNKNNNGNNGNDDNDKDKENLYPNSNRFMNKGNKRNISPDQYNLLQGLTNHEQLNKFMKISGILDQQKDQEINITNNLFLRKSPYRDFDPKEWGCRNCPCNIHGNPNVPCDCCGCNICPNKTEENDNIEKIKQKMFPINSDFSYTYSYED